MSDELASEIIEGAKTSIEIREALIRISDAGEQLLATGLHKRAIALLIKDLARDVRLRDIILVLETIPQLNRWVDNE